MSEASERFKDFESIIINNDQFEKCLRIKLSEVPENINVRNLLRYLKSNGWCNYKFNSYSIKPLINDQGTDTLIILSYIPPVLKFK